MGEICILLPALSEQQIGLNKSDLRLIFLQNLIENVVKLKISNSPTSEVALESHDTLA